MSLDKRNIHTNREFKSLQKSFEQWETGSPSADVWENLEADLAVSAVWDRLVETLEANGSSADKALVDSYENWSPNTSGDGWSRLEEQLSRERVWNRLNTTLNYPVTTRIPWMKMAAASILFVFLAFYTDRYTDSNSSNSGAVYLTAFENISDSNTTNNDRQIAAVNGTTYVPKNNTANNTPQNTDPQQRVIANNEVNGVNGVQNNLAQNTEKAAQNNELTANQNQVESTSNASASEGINAADLASLDQLAAREVSEFGPQGTIGDFDFLPFQAEIQCAGRRTVCLY